MVLVMLCSFVWSWRRDCTVGCEEEGGAVRFSSTRTSMCVWNIPSWSTGTSSLQFHRVVHCAQGTEELLLLAIAKCEKRKVYHYYNRISGFLECL